MVDYLAGPGGMTTNFDHKHMAKRCWRMLSLEKMVINGIVLTKHMLKQLLEGNDYGLNEQSLYPKDKQNVKSATFLLAFINAVTKKDELPYNILPIKTELQLLAHVFTGLLSFYVFTDISITDQIKSFSTASYLLYYLYTEHKTSLMPSQMYHDLQTSFQDALFCCAKSKEYCPTEPIFLLLDGTDLVERFFGNVQPRFKGGNYNTLEMINCAWAMVVCDRILMVDHPEWVNKSRMQQRLVLDYSNPAIWDSAKLTLQNVNIKATWKSGYYRALSMIPEGVVSEIEETVNTLCCLIKRGVVVGVRNIEQDWSIDDINEDEEDVSTDNSDPTEEPDLNLSEIIPDPKQTSEPFFMIDGKRVYKTTCLKAISSSQQLSKDRLRRVQGMSTYPGETSCSLDPDSFLLNGDPVLVHKDGPRIANIITITKSNKPLKQIDLIQNNKGMKDVELTLKFVETQFVDDKLFWKGTTSGESLKCAGESCLPIKPSVMLDPPDGLSKYYFNINLMRDMGVHLQLSLPEAYDRQPLTSSSNQSVVRKKCMKCRKIIPLSEMRLHVVTHILKKELVGSNICRFCGTDTCVITMKKNLEERY